MDIKFIARLKTDYNNWKELFDSTATEMNIFCDDHKTVVGQIGKNAALIALYDVDSVSYTHLRAHETREDRGCRLWGV